METGVDKIVATIQDSEFPTGKQVTIQHVCGALANTISIIFASKVTYEPYEYTRNNQQEFKIGLYFNYVSASQLELTQFLGFQYANEVIEES